MNRQEALHILGLDESATPEDIKVAYKETAQILHPDRFAGNKKLADRATEQFKNLQEAYEFLTSSKGGASGGAGRGGARQAGGRAYSRADELNARLAGIAAARTQLVTQRDTLLDQRRRGLGFLIVGLLVAFLFRRLRPIAAIAGAAFVWGLIDFISSSGNLKDLDKQLAQLNAQRSAIMDELAELE